MPEVQDDALQGPVPPSVVEAARRAWMARRVGATVAALRDERIDVRDGSCVFQFSTALLKVELAVVPGASGATLNVACPYCCGGSVDVLHGGETQRAMLDESGVVRQLSVMGPLLSVVLHPPAGATPVQTSWVRIH